MLNTILSSFLSIVFYTLGALHIYWGLGGKRALEQTLPTTTTGKKVLSPKLYHSMIVGIALVSFGIFYFIKSGTIDIHLPDLISNYGGWFISVLFSLRAVGDFKFVGLFKNVKETLFARLDTILFTPLCLTIGAVGIIQQLLEP